MLVIIPFFRGDKPQAERLAAWIAELGGVGKHDCLLAVHKDTDSAGVIEPLQKAFRRVAEFSITDDMIVEREQHAYAANIMWKRTANHVADMNEPADWFWLEPDAVPLSSGWLDAIAEAHAKSGKAFLHCLVETPRGRSNSGCGVYPAKVRDFTDRLWELSDTSWDVLLYPDFAPHTAYTNLIQDIGFLPGTQTLPTFPDAASLSILAPGAVLFHRSKDGSLIGRLRPMPEIISPNKLKALEIDAKLLSGIGTPIPFDPEPTESERLKELLERIADLEARLAERNNPKPPIRVKTKGKQKRVITPEHKAKLREALAKAREAKAKKAA